MSSRWQSLWLVAIDKIRLVMVVFFYFSKLAIVSYARVCEVISDHVTLDNFYLISRSRSTIFKNLPLWLPTLTTWSLIHSCTSLTSSKAYSHNYTRRQICKVRYSTTVEKSVAQVHELDLAPKLYEMKLKIITSVPCWSKILEKCL